MKRLIAFSLFCLALLNISAAEKGNWGIRAAFDVNIPGNWNVNSEHIDMYKPGCGFTIGAVYFQPIANGFYFEPGLSFFYDTYSYKDLTILGASMYAPASVSPSVRKAGLRLPLQFGYEFGVTETFRLAVYTGLELSYALSQKVHVDDNELLDDDIEGDLSCGHRRFDCAWKVGIAAPLNPVWIGIDAAIGLTDLMPGDVAFRENRVSVNVTYYF